MVFLSTSASKSSTGFCSWGCCGRLRSAPVRTWMWRLVQLLDHRGPGITRYSGSWQLGKQEIWYSRRAWQPTLYSFLENPTDKETGRPQYTGLQRVRHHQSKQLLHAWMQWLFLVSGSSVPVVIMHAGGAVAWIMGPWQCWLHRSAGTTVTGDMVLLGLFLACGSSASSEDWAWRWCSWLGPGDPERRYRH